MRGTVQACGSAVTVGVDVRHGQVVWFYDVDRRQQCCDTQVLGTGVQGVAT